MYTRSSARISTSVDGTAGVVFAVWAPNADARQRDRRLQQLGPERHPAARRGSSGIWEGFVPGLGQGTLYKYSIKPRFSTQRIDKADPFGFAAELRPRTASMVWDLARYTWHDQEWLAHRGRARKRFDAPISIYEVHLGSWKRVPETKAS